jgi:hypothetical protein
MEPTNDPQLSRLLKEWQMAGAPPSLDARVLGRPKRWWSFLLMGSIRLPVPVGLAIAVGLLAMAAALMRQPPAALDPGAPVVSLVDFRPAEDLNVRVIRRDYGAK